MNENRFKVAAAICLEDHRICYDLPDNELVNGPLADLICGLGYPSARSFLNSFNGWRMRVCDLIPILAGEDEP